MDHQAFVDALVSSDGDGESQATAAGLLVLRLVGAWNRGEHAEAWGLERIREEMDALGEPQQRDALLKVIEVVSNAREGDFKLVMPGLFQYARALEFELKWSLAVEVYNTVVRRSPSARDSLVRECLYRIARVRMTQAGPGAGRRPLQRLRSASLAANDVAGQLWADLGLAGMAYQSGNFPRAEAMLLRISQEAFDHHLDELRSHALHDLAGVAIRRGQYEDCIRIAHDALGLATVESYRQRIVCEIASAFTHLRMFDAAEDGFLAVMARSPERFVRAMAELNLLHIANVRHDEVSFARLASSIGSIHFTPELAAHFHMTRGEHELNVGDERRALQYFQAAIEISQKHALNELIIMAEQLFEIARTARADRGVSPTGELAVVAVALKQLASSGAAT